MPQIGEIKVYTESGEVDLPVYSSGDSGSEVHEFLRVHTENGTGFIPLTTEDMAAYPFLKIRTSTEGTLSVNNSPTVDSEVLLDGFEDGDLSEWSNTNNVSVTGGRSFQGDNSMYASAGTSTSTYLLGERGLGSEVSMIELYWRETSNSYGHGYQFLDSSGNRVAGAGTANPQWTYVDGNAGYQLYSGDGYNRWIRLRLEFDYQNNQVTYIFEDLNSETQKQVTAEMDSVGKVTQIQKVNADGASELYEQSKDTGGFYGALDTWTDSIIVERILDNTTLIEGFEDGNTSEYSSRRGGSFNTTESNVWEGTYSGRQSFGGTYYASHTDPDSTGPSSGDTFEFYFRTNNSNSSTAYGLLFAVQDSSDFGGGYYLRIGNNGNSLQIKEDGRNTNLASSSYSPKYNTWLRVVVDFRDTNSGKIKARVEDLDSTELGSVEASTSKYNSGGIGWIANDKGSTADWTVDNLQTLD